MKLFSQAAGLLSQISAILCTWLLTDVYFARSTARVPRGAIVFFPLHPATLCCGLAGIVSVGKAAPAVEAADLDRIETLCDTIESSGYAACPTEPAAFKNAYLGGPAVVADLGRAARDLKTQALFCDLFFDKGQQSRLSALGGRLSDLIGAEADRLETVMGRADIETITVMSGRLEDLKDIVWCIRVEVLENISKVAALLDGLTGRPPAHAIRLVKQINAVLNSIDRLEVRGRDSAGISLMFILEQDAFDRFGRALQKAGLAADLDARTDQRVLVNNGIQTIENQDGRAAIAFTYKVAAEIGSLGDNICFLRRQIRDDRILKTLFGFACTYHTISSHTRWASVGAITEPNCHPVDNITDTGNSAPRGIIQACLNGDIDNYRELRQACEQRGDAIHREITTDTKIIPLQIEHYLRKGHDVATAFRLAVNDFKGSHAISMHTDLAPGKLFLAQKGSGQAIFVGMAPDHYMPTSEVYGFIEETSDYLKLDGEKIVPGSNGPTQGQILVLDQASTGGCDGITGMYYDGTPLCLTERDVKHTRITSRDIDRQNFPHYFLKEISEAPRSVAQTLQNRWRVNPADGSREIVLDQTVVPADLSAALSDRRIRRIFFVGQGTAGVAAQACADILIHYARDPSLQVSALKASELSGFKLGGNDPAAMADALVIAISQSGTTTDTNRTVDMVRERGARTLAIVNRRDSDITFKVDGVLYTSSGRDIEMSVASTKAFYAQIIAGALLSLFIAGRRKCRDRAFISREIDTLLAVPDLMEKVLAIRDRIKASARRHAAAKTYWAAVGSGPNKASADEIRIKLSELCYKTISSDYVEDKKHIDLSAEPLIIVCAAGAPDTVIGDIVKDTAIFQAHQATPIVIADTGENRFAPYAADVFGVPRLSPHLAPILSTLAGHIWGYYAALTIHEGSRLLHDFREEIQNSLDEFAGQGLDVYEVVLEKSFREKFIAFYQTFRRWQAEGRFPAAIAPTSDLTLLLKYLAGRLPVGDFELDFDKKGTALNMLDTLFECLGTAINKMARPIDAIKHQAKTVTVGTSRIAQQTEGLLFDALAASGLSVAQVTNPNVMVLKNLQAVVAAIKGSILYTIDGLTPLGELTEDTTIRVKRKTGILQPIPSRVETDTGLKGTKRIIVQHQNVYIGKGRKDNRSIIVIPVMSAAPSAAGMIEYLLLLNIAFKADIPLPAKVKALGGKYDHIKNIVQENSVAWQDRYLEQIATDELFGRSAEKIGDLIVSAAATPP